MNKQGWLDLAEVIDAHRVMPRLLVVVAMVGYGWFAADTYFWVKDIYNCTKELPTSVVSYAGGTLSALGLVLTLLVNKYVDSGRKWVRKE